MSGLRFLSDFDPQYGHCVEVGPHLRRVVAQNPSKFTAWGTGTYIVGHGDVAIIDPGPAIDAHIQAVLDAVEAETVTHVLVTHTHGDHSPAAAAIKEHTGATTYGFGPHPDDADTGDEEHGDTDFVPDVAVTHGQILGGDRFDFECLHTPGHISNHVCFAELGSGSLFPGDHVMGWSTTVIPPPDGNVADYLNSLRLLLGRPEATYYPTHGPSIPDPLPFVEALIDHRLAREAQVLGLLQAGRLTIPELVAIMYADVRPELHEPAARSVEAHLIKLVDEGRVVGPDEERRYELRP